MANGRHKIIPASYLVLFKDNKVLMLRRFNTGYEDGNYSLPAGHVEENETFTQCVIREAKEEIGVSVDSKNLQVVHVMQRDSKTEKDNERIDTFLKAEIWSGEIKNTEPNKCDDLSWFDLDNLPDNTIPYIKQALENIREDIFYSQFGF